MMGMMGKMGPMGQMECGPEMMKKGQEMMKEKMAGAGFNPSEMCRQMTSSVTKAAEMGSYATPEVRALFEDWVTEAEQDILNFVKANNQAAPSAIAEQLKISENSVIFFISRLAQQEKIRITGIEICDAPPENETQKQSHGTEHEQNNQSGGGG